MLSDSELIERYLAGDASAFQSLYERYADAVFNYARKLTFSADRAEDITQEVFIQIVRKLGQYQEKNSFKAWVFTITRNLVIDSTRKKGFGKEKEIGEYDVPDEAQCDPADAVSSVEDVAAVKAAIESMPETMRDVMMLRHFSGLSFKEIAEIRECPIGTILSQVHRGLAMLKEKLT